MDIRPHRRLVVPFEPPLFSDVVEVSDFVARAYEHFGVARFNSDMFDFLSVTLMRRMCNSLGLKLLVVCSGPDFAVRAAADGADFVTAPVGDVHTVVSGVDGRSRVLVPVVSPMDLEMVKVSSASGVVCDSSFVGKARAGLQAGSLIFSSGGDVVAAVKDGADFATVDPALVRSPDLPTAFRQLAEDFREFT
jgi:hypothetical protein